MAFFTVSEKSV